MFVSLPKWRGTRPLLQLDLFVANATKFSLKDFWCVYTNAESDEKEVFKVQTTDILQKSPQELGNVHNKNAYTPAILLWSQKHNHAYTCYSYVVAIELQNMIK